MLEQQEIGRYTKTENNLSKWLHHLSQNGCTIYQIATKIGIAKLDDLTFAFRRRLVRVSKSYPKVNKSLSAPSVDAVGVLTFKGCLCHRLISCRFKRENLAAHLRLWLLSATLL